MVKPNGHSKSKIYNNHAKTGTDIPSGWEYVADQIKDSKSYVKNLNSYTWAVANQGKSRDRGDDINSPRIYPSDFMGGKPRSEGGDGGNKDYSEWVNKQNSQTHRKIWEGGAPMYKNPKRIN